MIKTLRNRFLEFYSDNLKSKIQNPKWVGLFAIVAVLTVCGARAEAQQTGKIFRIGYLDPGTASGSAVLLEAFREEMHKLGWIEGKNITIEYLFRPERLRELPADMVRLKLDLIMVTSGQTALAAKNATTTIPIVMTTVADPVGVG
jgi:putative ABC transport system substrate-binding protein